MVEGIVLIIPVYNPDEKFIYFLDTLTADGWKDIIIVDDGSKPGCRQYFDQAVNKYGCQLVKHNVNLGQGRAFKSAFNYFIGKYGGGRNHRNCRMRLRWTAYCGRCEQMC